MKLLILALSLASLTSFAQTNKSTNRVIGSDSRQRVNAMTYRPVHESIGVILIDFDGGSGMCTGTVVGPRHVITAAHCLTEKGKFVDNVSYVPAMNGDLYASARPFGTIKGIKMRVLKNYFKSEATEDDLGLITFSQNLPVPALPLGVLPKRSLDITIAGFPGDKIEGTLWEATGKRNVNFFGGVSSSHAVDTMPGQSGAAVRARLGGKETIVGIHSAGVKNVVFEDNNLALFLTSDLIRAINSWMAED